MTNGARFHTMYNVGRGRHIVNIHDGVTTHADGSPFYGIEIFRNMRKMNAFIRELRRKGYAEGYVAPSRSTVEG